MLTYEEEMDRKYGISDKLERIHDWEVKKIMEELVMEHRGRHTRGCIYTGFRDFDTVIGGLRRGETYLLAGRPAMGKTSFAISVISNLVRKDNKKVLYITQEISRERVIRRLLEIMSADVMLSHEEEEPEHDIEAAYEALAESCANLYIDDRPGMSVDEISEDCCEIGDVDLLIIDYLQLMSDPDYSEITERERWALCCEGLGFLAKEYDCPVLILSQLSKAIEARRDHRPRIEDVTGLVQGRSVDNVIFLYRDEYYFPNSPDRGTAEFYIAKRKGAGSSQALVRLAWVAEKGLFRDLNDQR